MKILSIIILLLISVVSFGQFPNLQTLGSPQTLTKYRGAITGQFGLINGVFSDTTTANNSQIDFYPGAMIVVVDTLFLRNYNATKWLNIAIVGSFTDNGFFTPNQTSLGTTIHQMNGNSFSIANGATTMFNLNAAGTQASLQASQSISLTANEIDILDDNEVHSVADSAQFYMMVRKKTGTKRIAYSYWPVTSTPTLQSVTDAGNTTTKFIQSSGGFVAAGSNGAIGALVDGVRIYNTGGTGGVIASLLSGGVTFNGLNFIGSFLNFTANGSPVKYVFNALPTNTSSDRLVGWQNALGGTLPASISQVIIGTGLSLTGGTLSATATTPGIDAVLAVNQTLTADRPINTSTFTVAMTGSGIPLNVRSTGGAIAASLGTDAPTFPLGTPSLALHRTTSGATANNLANIIDMYTEGDGGETITTRLVSVMTDKTAGSVDSKFTIRGVTNSSDGILMDIQQDGTVLVNGATDTLAKKSYARSLVPFLTQYRIAVGNASNEMSTNVAITGNMALKSDVNGVPTHSTTTGTQLEYLNTTTSNVQTQIDGKQTKTVGTYATRIALTPGDGDEFFQTDAARDAHPGKYFYLNGKWNAVRLEPERLFFDFNEFNSVAGANTVMGNYVVTGTITPANPGAIRFSTGTTTTGRSVIYFGANGISNFWYDFDNGSAYVKIQMKDLQTLSTVGEEYILRLGIADQAAGAQPNSGVFFEYNRLVSNNWRLVNAVNSGSRHETTTGVAVTTGAHTLEVFCSGTGGTSEWWLDGVSLGTSSTFIPSTSQYPFIQLVKSAGVTPMLIDFDYIKTWHYLTTSRN